jgi:hypothetical protein
MLANGSGDHLTDFGQVHLRGYASFIQADKVRLIPLSASVQAFIYHDLFSDYWSSQAIYCEWDPKVE